MIDAYVRTGPALDVLGYTPEFDAICKAVTDGNLAENKRRHLFKRLISLRKQGRLPVVARGRPA